MEIVVVELEDAAEVGEGCLGLEDVGVLVEALVGFLLVVVLVVDVAYDFLDDVFHGDDAAGAAELVYDDGDVYLVLLKVAKQVVYHLGLGDEIRGTDKGLPTEVGGLAEVRKQVLDVEDALDIVFVFAVDGDAAVVVVHDALEDLGEGGLDVEVYDVYAGGHDFACHLAAKADDALKHLAFLGYVLLVGEFHGFLEVVDGEGLGLVLDDAVGEGLAHHEYGGQGPEGFLDDVKDGGYETAEREGVLAAVYLGHDFAEQEEQESEQDGEEQELYPLAAGTEVYPLDKEVVEEYDDGYVDEVVEDEDGGEQAVGLLAQADDAAVGGATVGVEAVEVLGGEAEECYLAGRGKAAADEQEQADAQGEPCPGGGGRGGDMDEEV